MRLRELARRLMRGWRDVGSLIDLDSRRQNFSIINIFIIVVLYYWELRCMNNYVCARVKLNYYDEPVWDEIERKQRGEHACAYTQDFLDLEDTTCVCICNAIRYASATLLISIFF